MNLLLLHPLDVADTGPWTGQRWDRIVDVGLGGESTYARWRERFQCSIQTLGSFRNGFESFRRVRELLGMGCGRLVDAHGLDWWEIMSILLHEEMETLLLLQRFVQTLGTEDRVYVSRPGLHASLLSCIAPGQLEVFPTRAETKKSGPGHYLRVFKKLSLAQMIDVVWDKYDAGYQLRGRATEKRRTLDHPVVLLPTAYVNVSRTGVSYAETFPEEKFLLVATRRSGFLKDVPANVETAWLSSYASLSLRERRDEQEKIGSGWRNLLREFGEIREFEILARLGHLDIFPKRFRHGLEVRDAWRNVLDREPVQAVLCADDSNPYTRIPLLLARNRGLPNIACHHGALDGRYVFKRSYGDVIWTKGRMEQDYLVRKCGVPVERVEIAAPAVRKSRKNFKAGGKSFRPHILFFSEASDISGGRPAEFYRDIVPALADLAISSGRKVIVKLHPAESEHERTALLDQILSREQRAATQVVSGPLTDALLESAWFGITILSTAATECAIRGIPCFLCKWLEFWPYEYVEQFIRFGVGIGLNHPEEIREIPERLEQLRDGWSEEVSANCQKPAAAGRLREFLTCADKTMSSRGTISAAS